MQESPPHPPLLIGCSPPFMRLTSRLTAVRAWCKQCLHGQQKPDVLCPGIVGTRGSMVMQLRPCMAMSTPTSPVLPPPFLAFFVAVLLLLLHVRTYEYSIVCRYFTYKHYLLTMSFETCLNGLRRGTRTDGLGTISSIPSLWGIAFYAYNPPAVEETSLENRPRWLCVIVRVVRYCLRYLFTCVAPRVVAQVVPTELVRAILTTIL